MPWMTRPELELFSWELGKAVCYMSSLRKKTCVGVPRDCVCARARANMPLSGSEVLEHWLWSAVPQAPPHPLPHSQPAAPLPRPALRSPSLRGPSQCENRAPRGSRPLSLLHALLLHPTLALPRSWTARPSGPPESVLRKCSQGVPAPTPLPFTYL